jgi:hypothetical protein
MFRTKTRTGILFHFILFYFILFWFEELDPGARTGTALIYLFLKTRTEGSAEKLRTAEHRFKV